MLQAPVETATASSATTTAPLALTSVLESNENTTLAAITSASHNTSSTGTTSLAQNTAEGLTGTYHVVTETAPALDTVYIQHVIHTVTH
jgi:hypothetical protein